ncbi:MAG: TVP38/TMEM64 family protein [Lachnospiraceae bacterium]|jgi:uncharacterized membrane protein YdjX (TVP38/TMEM64 family)|nr:TVP38/TMEM64 family protein [Lachnospiraceae bacterium]
MNSEQKKSRIKENTIKISIFLILIIGLIYLNHIYGFTDMIKNGEFKAYMDKMIRENILISALIYLGVTVIGCVLLALPGAFFAILSGVLFGPILGSFLCLLACTIGAMLAFLVGRFFLKDAVKPMLKKNKLLSSLLFSENKNHDIILLMITRIIPIFPYNLQNFAYGVTDINFSLYSLYSFIFMMPGVVIFTVGTAGALSNENRMMYVIIAVAVALFASALGLFVHKKYVKQEK